MDDSSAAQQAAEGLLLILGSFSIIPAGIAAGVTALASAAGYFFGVKHEAKRARKREQKSDADFIQNIIDNKEEEDA